MKYLVLPALLITFIGCAIGSAMLQESAVNKAIDRKLKEIQPVQCPARGKVML